MEKRLKDLPDFANEMMSDVTPAPQTKAKILEKAADKKEIRFRPLRAIPAFCCALIVLVGAVWGIPHMLTTSNEPAAVSSQPAGGSQEQTAMMRADVPSGSISLSNGADVPAYRSIWARASGSYFPLVRVDGRTYRMLTTPGNLSSKQLGSSLGAVGDYTTEPSLSGDAIVSNTVLAGETIYEVKNMSGAAVAAKVDGKVRVFQRVSMDENAIIGSETLADTLGSASVSELSLSGVGVVSNAADAQALLDTLTSNASYQKASTKTSSQALLIKYSNGVTLQLAVSGEKVMACGTWACPEFFEAFQKAL